MNTLFPIFLRLEEKPCLVVGGGRVARQKVQQLLESKASVTVIAPDADRSIQMLAKTGVIKLLRRRYKRGDVGGNSLVIGATGHETINEQVFREALSRGIPVNIVDQPDRCTFYMASIHRQGDLKIAVSTNGKNPALGQLIRNKIKEEFGLEYGRLLDKLSLDRQEIVDRVSDPGKKVRILKDMAWEEFQQLTRVNEAGDKKNSDGHFTKGKVYLVGAGPGDPDLITVKGLNSIGNADVIFYDALIHDRLLRHARKQAELICVGKKPENHRFDQETIDQMLIENAERGRMVVRLKGGDPFLFGRGGEEAEALTKARIPFEVIPGVTAGVGATAYAGIPLTHRDHSSTVSFVTGHLSGSENRMIRWDYLSKSADTLVIYMGVRNLPNIVTELVAGGRSVETPVAVIYRGTYEDQKVVIGTLENIVNLTCEAGIRPPAITVVGNVVKLHSKLHRNKNQTVRTQDVIISQ